MRPSAAVARRVRVFARHLSVSVVKAVRHDPVDGAAFEGQRPADRQQVLDPFRRLVPPVREKAVKAHADRPDSRQPTTERQRRLKPAS